MLSMRYVVTKLSSKSGQSTVEFALIVFAIVCVVIALGVLLHNVEAGMFLEHAISAASHSIVNSVSGITDSFCY